jgi:hypothetical protein
LNRIFWLCLFCLLSLENIFAQQDTSAIAKPNGPAEEDPANFITCLEVFNKLQQLQNNEYMNVTTVRAVVALGHNFTTRLDIPMVYNSTYVPG